MPKILSAVDVVKDSNTSTQAVAQHFESVLSFETDCWDVHEALKEDAGAFVLIDARDAESFALGHLPGAIHLPAGKITESRVAHYPPETLFIVYCTGPHCNGADKAALRLAKLGRNVKKMIGGMWGWRDYYGWRVEST